MELSLNLVKVSALLGEETGEPVSGAALALVTVRGFFSRRDLREASFSGESGFTGEVRIDRRGSGGGVETMASLVFTLSA